MADVASPAAPVDGSAKKENVKPEKPDEEVYKASLKKAEKEHADSMAKFVSEPLAHACETPLSTANCIDSY
jgi:hypothetical protein